MTVILMLDVFFYKPLDCFFLSHLCIFSVFCFVFSYSLLLSLLFIFIMCTDKSNFNKYNEKMCQGQIGNGSIQLRKMFPLLPIPMTFTQIHFESVKKLLNIY